MLPQKPGIHPPESKSADRQVGKDPEQLGQLHPPVQVALAEPHRHLFLVETGIGAVIDWFEIHGSLLYRIK